MCPFCPPLFVSESDTPDELAHEAWIKKYGDLGAMEERAMIKKLWNGKDAPPMLEKPTASFENGVLTIKANPTSTICYKSPKDKSWKIYTKPLQLGENERVVAVADRIGYVPSPMVFQD